MAGKLLLVVNPCAGQRKATENLAELIRMFSDFEWDSTVYVTGGKGDATEYLRARAGEYDRIVCAGGDGTLNEVFSGVLASGTDRPIGYLPAGTTNDYANTLGLSRDMITAGHDVMTGVERRMDVGVINGRYFAYTASFGAFTRTAYNTPQAVKNVLGHLAYVLEGVRELPRIRSIPMKIVADDREIEDEFIFGAVNNSTSVGGILKLDANLVSMDDGKFEVLLVRNPRSAAQLNRLVLAVTRGDFESDMMRFFQASKLRMELPGDVNWTRDGEFEDGRTEVEIENLCRAMRFIVPRSAQKKTEA